MKKNPVFQLVLLFALMVSCGDNNKNTIVVIEQNDNISSDLVTFGKDADSFSPKIEDNLIIYTISPLHSDYYQLAIGGNKTSIFLSPGDSIYIPSEFMNFGNEPNLKGDALLSNYILADKLLAESINETTNFDSIYALSPLAFIRSVDSIYNLRKKRLTEFVKLQNIADELFVSTENKRILYEASIEKNRYYRDHKFLTGQIVNLNDEFNNYLLQVDFNDEKILHLDAYRDFLYTHFESVGLQEKDRTNNPIQFTEIAFYKALNFITNPVTRGYTLYRIMDIHLNETPINDLGNLIDDFKMSCLDEKLKDKINSYYSRLAKLKKGMPAPNFTFPDQNGQMISLEDLKGEVVLIDIWNSHCSPCFKEFPILDELIEKYENRGIVFLGISFDSDRDLWNQTMEGKKLKGIQLFANGWNHEFGKDYLVYSNPRYILIDREGTLIDAKAPRPSGSIEELINQYIN